MNIFKQTKRICPLMATFFGVALTFGGSAIADEYPIAARGNTYHHAVELGIERAKASLDDARARYFAQLQSSADFFCAVRIADETGNVEQVFVKIGSWGERITGTIANQPAHVRGYVRGDAISFDTGEVMDWILRFHNGRVEGNFVAESLRAYGLG